MFDKISENISSTSDAPPPDPSGPSTTSGISTAKSPEVMDVEENIVEPLVTQLPLTPQTSASTIPSTTQISTEVIADSSDNANGRKFQLEEQELLLGGGLNSELYAELLLIYLVQQKRIESKFCFMRAVEKFDDRTLRNIWKTGHHMYDYDFARALKEVNGLSVQGRLQHYVIELKKRLIATQLKLIAKAYSAIELEEVANLLAIDKNDELHAVISTCEWKVDNDGFVLPIETPQLHEMTAGLVDPLYGTIEHPKKVEPAMVDEKKRENYIEKLKHLVSFSDFIDNH